MLKKTLFPSCLLLTLLLHSCATTSVPVQQPRFKVLGTVDLVVGQQSMFQPQAVTLSSMQLKASSTTQVDHNGYRYISTTYQVRNATSAGVPSVSSKTNLTLLATETLNTLQNTAVRQLKKADGSAADPSLARQVLPAGNLTAAGVLGSAQSVQFFSKSELSAITGITNVVNVFPYGYVIDRVGGGRTLGANPATTDYQGTVTVSVKIPLQNPIENTPSSLVLALLNVEDSVTQVSETSEEASLGNSGLGSRISAAGASRVNVFPGSTYAGTKRTLCSVPVSSNASPSYLINTQNRVTATSPSTTSLPARNSTVTSTLGYCDDPILTLSLTEPQKQLSIQGFQSGKRLLTSGTFSQTGNQWSFAPSTSGRFKPGEEVEVVTVGSSSLQSKAMRFRVATTPQGSAGFGSVTSYTAGGSPQQLRFGDLNNDGNLDAVVANNGSMGVFLNSGSGVFAPMVPYTAGATANGVDLGDIDNDGDLDAVLGNGNACQPCNLTIQINGGGGTFTQGASLTTSNAQISSTLGVAFGDFNNDGNLDVVGASNLSLSQFLGNGNGTFQTRTDYTLASGTVNFVMVAVGDLNNDGHQDVVAVNATGNSMSIFLNKADGSGTFNTPTTITTPNNPRSIALGDLNKDGKLDVVTSSIASGNVIAVFMGNGDGTVQTNTNYASSSAPQQQVALGDINGDGNLDVVTANGNTTISGVSVYLGTGTGTLQTATVYPTTANQSTRGVALGDVNGDGKLDVGATTLSNTALNILLKN